jgi:hypothetical protein
MNDEKPAKPEPSPRYKAIREAVMARRAERERILAEEEIVEFASVDQVLGVIRRRPEPSSHSGHQAFH